MTLENKKKNIADELGRSKSCLVSADLLSAHSQYNDAVSRLYYFLFHALIALLLFKGFEPKTHEGTLRLFSLHFVRPGIFDPQDSHLFARLMKYREEADYNPSYVFTPKDYLELREAAEALSNKIIAYLSDQGYV